jgi:opacity protein-like surface antigen
MKRTGIVLVGLLSLAGVGSLAAQQGIRVGIGGGLLMPLGDYKTADKMGWLLGADATYWLAGAPVGIRIEGDYSQTSHKSTFITSGNSKIFGGLAEVVYAFGTKADQLRPYIMGGIGYFNFKESASGSSESKVGFGGGAGVALKVGTGSTRVFAEARFTSVSTSGGSTTFLPIRAGLRFGGK